MSIVVPIYSEEPTIGEFYSRARRAVSGINPPVRHEFIFVDDGSTDGSMDVLARIAREDACAKVVSLSRNFGHQIAITAGLDHATGDAVVLIDGDLQDPPELVGEMVRKWRDGYKVVYGVRSLRKGETALKLLTAKAFYRALALLSDVEIPLDSGDFRLLDRVVVDALRQVREESRFLRGLISWVGFAQCPLPYERDARFEGKSKFRVGKMVKFALDGISTFSDKPLRFSSHLGLLVTAASVLYMLWLLFRKIVAPASSVPGWTSVMVAVLFLGGIQLLSVGILGEYVGRIFRETKRRPLYIVASRTNFRAKPGEEASRSGPAEGRNAVPAEPAPAVRR